MKIVVTGGHLSPAIAIIQKLKKLEPTLKVYFFGRRTAVEGDRATSFEFLEISRLGIPFFEISTGRLQRQLTKYSFLSFAKIIPGFVKSLVFLLKIKPDVVLTFGGYIALPVAVASKILQIPIVAHEQSPNLGLANKIIFKLAKLKGVSEKSLKEKLGNGNVLLTGPLLREEIFQNRPKSKSLQIFLEKASNEKLIYITGGATGSHFLNQLAYEIIGNLLEKAYVICQTGNLKKALDFKKLTSLKKKLPLNLSDRLYLTEFVGFSDIGAILTAADLVISRSGANTTSELAVLGKVAIIIPLEWGVEQKRISQNLQDLGSFVVIFQNQARAEKILATVDSIFQTFDNFLEKAEIVKKKIPKNGAEIFARQILNFGF